MYELKSINQATATRTVELINLETGTKDICFDDSELTGSKGFEFMEINKNYDCKITLFGDVVKSKNETSVSCLISDLNVRIGEKTLVKVIVNQDVYYLSKKQLEDCKENDIIEYSYTRKDLIQVDEVIHGDLLTNLW